ncbi:MAG: SPFH domain-containing protein, partial [Patescibacteria group bacterium]|nr:SPFH domain-containing protein [Patescibacteria group bacterium]
MGLKVIKLIVWVAMGLGLIVIGILQFIDRNLWGIPFVLAGVWILGGVWILMSIKIIGPKEMAVFVLLGQPIEFRDSGPHFVPWLFAWLVRYPKKMFKFDYPKRKVITKEGWYKPKDDPQAKEKYYGSQELEVDSSAYTNFPRERGIDPDKREAYMKEQGLTTNEQFEEAWKRMTDKDRKKLLEDTHPLIKILRSGIPIDEKELEKWTEDAVVGALRVGFGQMTWKEGVENISKVNEETEKVFKRKDGALIKGGFREPGIRLVITEIHLPSKIKQALPEVDRRRLEAEAAPFEAEQIGEEIGGAVIKTFCQLTGMSKDEMQRALKEDPEAFLKKYEKLWEKAWRTVHKKMAIDGNAHVDMETPGATPWLGDVLRGIAAWLRMPMGRSP